MERKIVDHLFRHQYGKMVAILIRLFGLSNIETIEDAVQDTFIKATLQWRSQIPENPEPWLIKVAKNRTIDILRSVKAEKNRFDKVVHKVVSNHTNDIYLDHEIEDSQLRMISWHAIQVLNQKNKLPSHLRLFLDLVLKKLPRPF